MKNRALPALVAVVALASGAVACSSNEESNEVDTGSAISALQSPTGTLTRASAGKAFGGYRQQRNESSKVSAPAQSGGGLSTQSLKFLDQTSSAGRDGSQACPSGGSMTYQAEQNADGALVKVKATSCAFEDGFSFDGNMVLLASKKSILGISSEASAPSAPPSSSPSGSLEEGEGVSDAPSTGMGNGYVALLVAAKGTASYGSKKSALEFALLAESRYSFLAVKVDDGSIVIGLRDDGKAIVRTKNGTWSCNESGSRWSCTSDKGEQLEASEELESEGSTGEIGSAVPAPSGSSSSGKPPVPAPSGEEG